MPLWVLEYRGRDIPIPDTAPALPADRVVIAESHFAVVRATHAEVDSWLQGFPYWRNAGHPSDGRWIGSGGDEVYLCGGEVIDSPIPLWESVGLRPQDFGVDTWADVDETLVWPHVAAF